MSDGRMNEDLRRVGLKALWSLLDSLRDATLGEPNLPEGRCDECGAESPGRWRLGAFALCYPCRARRAAVQARLDSSARIGPAAAPETAAAPQR